MDLIYISLYFAENAPNDCLPLSITYFNEMHFDLTHYFFAYFLITIFLQSI